MGSTTNIEEISLTQSQSTSAASVISEPSSASTKRLRSNSASESVPGDLNGDGSAGLPEHDASWKGWAELENDPIIFSTLLREWGVPNVEVNEVVPLDAILETPSDSVFGLIFLSRWTAADTENDLTATPAQLWFANQTSSFSCATLAIMNILNNRADIDLGWRLNEFRNATMNLSTKDRGLALDDFQYVRDVHNSFATEFDKMTVDLRLKGDATAAAKKKRADAAAAKSKRVRKPRKKASFDYDEEENGFHFIAYVPAMGRVWRMDGMEALPQGLGTIAEGDNWLAMVIPELQRQWESAAANQLEFSLLSLGPTTNMSALASDQLQMQRTREDWGPFIAHMVKLHAAKGDLKEMMS